MHQETGTNHSCFDRMHCHQNIDLKKHIMNMYFVDLLLVNARSNTASKLKTSKKVPTSAMSEEQH